MKALLDTHFIVWIFNGNPRLERYPWLGRYQPWGLSPVSLLELTYLIEKGRVLVQRDLPERLSEDSRFEIDDISLLTLIRYATPLSWTRDVFDRLIAAHSAARRIPLCSVDESVRRNHAFVADELRIRG